LTNVLQFHTKLVNMSYQQV